MRLCDKRWCGRTLTVVVDDRDDCLGDSTDLCALTVGARQDQLETLVSLLVLFKQTNKQTHIHTYIHNAVTEPYLTTT